MHIDNYIFPEKIYHNQRKAGVSFNDADLKLEYKYDIQPKM